MIPLSSKKAAIRKFHGEQKLVSPIKKQVDAVKEVKKLFKDGRLSKFASTDLLRMYEVVDGIYDEYLEGTSDTRPAANSTLDEAMRGKANEQKLLKDLTLKSQIQAKCVSKLDLKNRKRIAELNDGLLLPKRKKVLTKKDFESYER